jgi:hypothetical protein
MKELHLCVLSHKTSEYVQFSRFPFCPPVEAICRFATGKLVRYIHSTAARIDRQTSAVDFMDKLYVSCAQNLRGNQLLGGFKNMHNGQVTSGDPGCFCRARGVICRCRHLPVFHPFTLREGHIERG